MVYQVLKGKNAIVTGASSGIGREVSISLARSGCNVFMVARREEKLQKIKEQLEEELDSSNIFIEYAAGDVTNEKFAQRAVLQACELFGGLNILVLCAGAAFIKSFNSTSNADFRHLMEVNMFGIINFCREGIKKITPKGSIILITSPAGVYGAKGMTAYAMSKGGIIAFGKSLALELAAHKIRVNVISPGFVETEMTETLYGKLNDAQKEQIKQIHPLGIGSTVDVANAIKFLASDESSWITGVVLPVDGGFTTGT